MLNVEFCFRIKINDDWNEERFWRSQFFIIELSILKPWFSLEPISLRKEHLLNDCELNCFKKTMKLKFAIIYLFPSKSGVLKFLIPQKIWILRFKENGNWKLFTHLNKVSLFFTNIEKIYFRQIFYKFFFILHQTSEFILLFIFLFPLFIKSINFLKNWGILEA